MKTIVLTQGQVALVDDVDFEALSQFRWCAQWNIYTKSYYAVRVSGSRVGGIRKLFCMHRVIMGVVDAGRGIQIDHRNHNTLDNRRKNLKPTGARGNQSNRKGKAQGRYSSRYVGVAWYKAKQKWRAQIQLDGKQKFLGFFSIEEDAAAAYQQALNNYKEMKDE